MERIEIKTTLTQDDWQAYQAHFAERIFGNDGGRLPGILLGAAVVVACAALADYLDRPLPLLGIIAGIFLGTAGSFYNAIRARRYSRPDPEGSLLGPCSLTIDTTGIEIAKPGSRTRFAWNVVQETTLTSQHLFIWVDRLAAILVPLRDLPAGLGSEQLSGTIEAFRNTGTERVTELESLPPPELSPVERPTPSPPHSLKRFLRAYAALLCGRTPAAADLATSPRMLLIFAASGLGMWLIFDRWQAGANAMFVPHAVLEWCWYLVILLTTTLAASQLARPRVAYDRILTLAVAFVPVVVAAQIAWVQWVEEDWHLLAAIAVAIYGVVYFSQALRSLTLRSQPRAVWTVAAILCAAVWLTQSLYLDARFWYAPEEELEDDGSGYWQQMRQSEALLFSQPERINTAMQAVQRPDDVPAAVFFVGFAGMGEERVFAGEIALAQRVVADRFGSAQRSVRLVNDRRDLQTLPLASPSALRYTLKSIAARMRTESDVLFLALSSHGSREGELSVSNGMLSLNDLSASDLAVALHESGIRWKVIVVSACYAGKFIEPLRDDNTIIIAAAAVDRTSFGCSDDRDLTYFGEAFYRDALPNASSLQAAFDKASAEIALRERAEGKRASNPQAHFGRALVSHLQLAFPDS